MMQVAYIASQGDLMNFFTTDNDTTTSDLIDEVEAIQHYNDFGESDEEL